jgi:hypothetical protein
MARVREAGRPRRGPSVRLRHIRHVHSVERRGDQRAVPAGEAQRRGRRTPGARTYPAPGKLERLDQFSGWLYAGQKIGHAGLVTAAAGPHYESVIADMAEQLGNGSRTPQDAVDTYYPRVRMRRSFGTLIEVDRRNRVLPLFSAPAIAAAFGLASHWRHAQFLPYSLMAATDPRFATTPFAADVWPKALGTLVDSPLLTPEAHFQYGQARGDGRRPARGVRVARDR